MSEEVRKRIVILRTKKGLTQAQIADLLGMRRTTYTYHEEHGRFKKDTLEKLAEVLEVSTDDILHGSEPQFNFEPPKPDSVEQLGADEQIGDPLFIPTAKEVKLIKVTRFLSKERLNRLRLFINELYHEEQESRQNK